MAKKNLHRINTYVSKENRDLVVNHAKQRNVSQSTIVDAALTDFFKPEPSWIQTSAMDKNFNKLHRNNDLVLQNQKFIMEFLGEFFRYFTFRSFIFEPDTHPTQDKTTASRTRSNTQYQKFLKHVVQLINDGKGISENVVDDFLKESDFNQNPNND